MAALGRQEPVGAQEPEHTAFGQLRGHRSDECVVQVHPPCQAEPAPECLRARCPQDLRSDIRRIKGSLAVNVGEVRGVAAG
jgi:hypothetical protein